MSKTAHQNRYMWKMYIYFFAQAVIANVALYSYILLLLLRNIIISINESCQVSVQVDWKKVWLARRKENAFTFLCFFPPLLSPLMMMFQDSALFPYLWLRNVRYYCQ